MLSASISYGQEAKKEVKPTDALIELIVEKAKLYSDKGEMVITKGVDFVMEQAKPTVKEFLTWRIISHVVDGIVYVGFLFIGCMSILCLNIIWPRKLFYDADADKAECNGAYHRKDEWPTRWSYILVVSCILTLIGFCGTFIGGKTSSIEDFKLAAEAYCAPRVYIIEQTAEWVKSHK